jgi:hypothetical protein
VLLLGDSFAMQLAPAILQSWPGVELIQVTKSSCGAIFDLAPVVGPRNSPTFYKTCFQFSDDVRDWLATAGTVKYAVVSSNFSQYVAGGGTYSRDGGESSVRRPVAEVGARFVETLRELEAAGIRPVVVTPLPSTGKDIGRCLARAQWIGVDLRRCDIPKSELRAATALVEELMKNVEDAGFTVVRLDRLLCTDSICTSHVGSTFIYRDNGHFSIEGSKLLGSRLDFRQLLTGRPGER